MSLRRHVRSRTLPTAALAAGLFVAGLTGPDLAAQIIEEAQPWCIQNVSLDREGEAKGTLLLRDGRIAAVLDAGAPAPAGTRVIDATGLICLPAFVDAYSRTGVTVPEPVKDQDVPPDIQKDVAVDMRLANRKGIQPSFDALEALAWTSEESEDWRQSGFGALLVSPGGELLAGSSALLTTRDAAHRDVVLRDRVFAHAAFAATGPDYPRTLMGFFAQLRQFFLDAGRHAVLQARFERRRPGPRPPHDDELEYGARILAGDVPLLCEVSESDDVHRWLRLAEEFGLKFDVVGDREIWRVADDLAEHDMAVVLSLDWGKEVDDPRPKKKDEQEEAADEAAETAVQEASSPVAKAVAEGEKLPEYVEPFEVRVERRLEWERERDAALRLREVGVPFVFGTAGRKPKDLLKSVRELIEAGLPADEALAVLTTRAAAYLGVDDRLGRIEPGYDATLALWRSDPLTDAKATVAWTFVDGFPSEYPEKKKKEGQGGPPGEGIDPTGTWELEFEGRGGEARPAKLVIEMDADGVVTGTIEMKDPRDDSTIESEVEGQVSGDQLELTYSTSRGDFEMETTLTAKIAGDELEGESSFHGPWSEEAITRPFTGKRTPDQE